LAAKKEEAPSDARLVITGFLRRPRNSTSKPENRPTTPFAVVLYKMRLAESYINGNTHKEKFAQVDIWRRVVISSSCSKDEVKEGERSKKQHTLRSIKLSATQSHWVTHFLIPP